MQPVQAAFSWTMRDVWRPCDRCAGVVSAGRAYAYAFRRVILRFCIVHTVGAPFMCVYMHHHASSCHGVIGFDRS